MMDKEKGRDFEVALVEYRQTITNLKIRYVRKYGARALDWFYK